VKIPAVKTIYGYMKILLLCGGRVGSYTVAYWLAKELNLEFFTEVGGVVDYKKTDNIIVKRSLENNNFNLDDIIYFDKIIRLYRKNTLKQSESNLYAILNKKWHHTSDTVLDGFYTINEDFLIENHEDIWLNKYGDDYENKKLFNLDFGLLISYEEIFETMIGEKLIGDYIGFKSKTKIDTKLKLRKENQQDIINSYEREIKQLWDKIHEVEDDHRKLIYEVQQNQQDIINSHEIEIKQLLNKLQENQRNLI